LQVVAGNRDFVHNIRSQQAGVAHIPEGGDIRAQTRPGCTPYGGQVMIGLQYARLGRRAALCRWRNPIRDTLRFYALRLHEVGMIKATPQKLIAQGTDWHFLNELKRELKV
jgi:hypothetical protein